MAPGARRSSGPASGWLAGVVLGVVGGISLVSLGVPGIGFLAVALVLIAWKGPRLLAGAGLVTGLGLIWTVLFARVQLTCGADALFADPSCFSDDLTPWIAGATGIFVTGLVASALALRRETR